MTKEDPLGTLKYDLAPPSVLAFRLVVTSGPRVGTAHDVPPNEERVVVGTAEGCTITVDDLHVSRRHFALVSAYDRIELEDLGSSNGTWVNGVQVRECALRGGELVRAGETTFRLESLGRRDVDRATSPTSFGRAIGRSHAMQRVFAACVKLAESSVPLLIEAETGTGKELLAESIHQAGPRRDRPFVVFDPTRVTEADEQMALFERADGGSLLIDGPADMTLELQRKLMRTIERGELQRVGSDRVTKVDVRLITTSLADVDRAVEDGRLREDLVHRLFAVRLSIPPLRRRREDIPPLFEHFWRTLGGGDAPVPASLVTRYESYAWPGNVRELQNVVAREIVLGDTSADTDEALAPAPEVDVDLPFPQARQLAIARFEEAYVTRLLERHGGNISRAAAASGVAHRYFQILKARHKR